MPIQWKAGGGILWKTGGGIAFDPACCCGGEFCPCPNPGGLVTSYLLQYHLKITDNDSGSPTFGTVLCEQDVSKVLTKDSTSSGQACLWDLYGEVICDYPTSPIRLFLDRVDPPVSICEWRLEINGPDAYSKTRPYSADPTGAYPDYTATNILRITEFTGVTIS